MAPELVVVLISLIILLGIVLIIGGRVANDNKEFLCTTCHHVGKTRVHVPGSLLITLFLLLFGILPGVIYEIWRSSAKRRVCSSCKSQGIVPLTSPIAQKLLGQSNGGK